MGEIAIILCWPRWDVLLQSLYLEYAVCLSSQMIQCLTPWKLERICCTVFLYNCASSETLLIIRPYFLVIGWLGFPPFSLVWFSFLCVHVVCFLKNFSHVTITLIPYHTVILTWDSYPARDGGLTFCYQILNQLKTEGSIFSASTKQQDSILVSHPFVSITECLKFTHGFIYLLFYLFWLPNLNICSFPFTPFQMFPSCADLCTVQCCHLVDCL